MLILFTWASIALAIPSVAASGPTACDTIKSQGHDTAKEQGLDISRHHTIYQENPIFRTNSPFNRLFDPRIGPQQLVDTLNLIFKDHPLLRSSILKEMLIPSAPLINSVPVSPIESFNRQLAKDSKFTPFERMSLIAKRYALYNSNDKSLKSHQLDILGTILWLQEILK